MNTPKKTSYILGITFYITGLVLCLLIASSSVMADIEAEFYGFDELSKGRFSTLRCPAVLNENETGTVRVTVTNTLDRPIDPLIRTDISTPVMEESTREQVPLEIGQTQVMQWQVDKDNIDLRNFIFVKVYIFPEYPLPLREATCGIFVINLPILKGSQWLGLALVLGIGGLGLGLILLRRSTDRSIGRVRERLAALTLLAALLVAAVICAILGWWVWGGILLVACVLTMFAMLLLL